jgi:hypothetical protein
MSGSPVAIHAEGRLMRVAPTAGLVCALLIAACSGAQPAPPATQQPIAAAAAPTAPPAPAPNPPTTAVATQTAAAALEPANPSVAPPATPSQSTGKPPPAVAKAPAAAASKAVAKPKKKSTAPDVAKKASPTLNLTSLEQRLKDTKAIGVLTKIALKNEIDDLLDKFREFHLGKLKTTLAELRRPFDLLVLKVLSLLQDSDPLLASAIVASREAIWGILADPAKFATVS